MNIFSFSPRNQLPNLGLTTGNKYYQKTVTATLIAARRLSFLSRNQLPSPGLTAGNKYYWKPAITTSSSSSAPQALLSRLPLLCF